MTTLRPFRGHRHRAPHEKVMLQAVLIGLGLAIIGMIAAAFNLIPVVVGAFMQEAIDVVSILWALTVLFDRGESA